MTGDSQAPLKKSSLLPIAIGSHHHHEHHGAGRKQRSALFSKRRGRSSSNDATTPAKPRARTALPTTRLLGLMFLVAFLVCMICLATLGFVVQQNALSNGDTDAAGPQGKGGMLAALRNTQVVERLQRLTNWFASVDNAKVRKQKTREELLNLGDYACVGWRQTMNCTPNGVRETANDRNCSTLIANGVSGYCEVQHKVTGERKRVMKMHCDSLRPGVQFSCDMFQSLLGYSILSTDYVHDPNFTYAANQEDFRRVNKLADTPIPVGDDGIKNQSVGQLELSFERGIVMVIYEKLLLGAYVSVRSLRAMGSTLPVEMWYKSSETNVNHPLLRLLVSEYGVYLREIDDPLATRFYTKLHAVFYSAFDHVLLLDADNFPVRDPSYLFETKEYLDTGAMFWPDFWKPGNTIFNIHENSFVWPVFGLDYVNMFEQESGQVLINRRKHWAAMNVLMYYGFSLPRIHEEMRLVWGDKDLFRFAWMKTDSSFYMIPRPPGSAGTKHTDYELFCGVTMVQHDPDGKVFPQFKRCFGKDVHYEKLFTLKPMSAFAFENLEADLLRFAREGAAILNKTAPAVSS
ncbi:hypothetical protein PINS_up012528 [Pythium insidiosum]|nr:hypothetical protein PINS_up012528 [Pythium insidiosum]